MINPASEMLDKTQVDYAKMADSFREMAENAVAQSTENYEKFKSLAEEATETAQKSFDAVREGMATLSTKAMENAHANAKNGVAHVEKLSRANTFAEILDLQGAFFRTSFETLSAQAKEAQELAVKVVEIASAPVKAHAEKSSADVSAVITAAVDAAPKAAAKPVKAEKAA